MAEMTSSSSPQHQQQQQADAAASAHLENVNGKLTKFALLRQLSENKNSEVQQLTEQLTTKKSELCAVTKELTSTSEELSKLRHNFQQSAEFDNSHQLMSWKETDDDQQQQEEVQHQQLLKPTDVGLGLCRFSVTRMLLDAANDATELEHKYEMMKMMLNEKSEEVDRLNDKLQHSNANMQSAKEKITQLNSDIAKLKSNIPPSADDVLVTSDDENSVSLSNQSMEELHVHDVTSMNPDTLREKYRQLSHRIKDLMKNNEQWKRICDRLNEDIETAKQQLINCQQETQQKLTEERLKTSKAVEERDVALAEVERQREQNVTLENLCRQLSADVDRLENTVHDLELRLKKTESAVSATETLSAETDQDEVIAVQMQLEEYRQDLAEERRKHEQAKENVKSMEQTWKALYDELRTKQDELSKAKYELDELTRQQKLYHILLEEANIDKQMIKTSLESQSFDFLKQASGTTASSGLKSAYDPANIFLTKTSVNTKEKSAGKPGVLEEDGITAATASRLHSFYNRSVRNHQNATDAKQWICDVCYHYNTPVDERSSSCLICGAAKRDNMTTYSFVAKDHVSRYGSLVADGITSV